MSSTEPRSPFTRRGFIAATVVVGIIVLAAIIVLVTVLTRGSTDTPKPGTSSSPPASSTGTTADKSICGLPGFETENTLTKAPNSKWELVGILAAPTDPTGAGPGRVEDGLRSCFAHTAKGALYMAVNFLAMGTDASFRDRLPQLVEPGPGRDALVAATNKTPSISPSSARGQIAGYRIGSYSARSVTVDLAVNYSTGQLVSLPMKLVWAEGDWKVQLTGAGQSPIPPAQIQNLGGYTPWSGA